MKIIPLLKPQDRIIVALDVNTVDKGIALVEGLQGHVGSFKIGLEFITAMLVALITAETEEEAIDVLRNIRRLFALIDGNLFWDGKFDDIPNTVAGAVKALAKMSMKMFNTHASPGIATMMAAAKNKGDMIALAVTVLTSLDENNAHLNFGAPAGPTVLQFARDAKLAGFDGVVCSPLELPLLANQPELGDDFIKVTPGIRDRDSKPDDQNRTRTAYEAIMGGATYLVIGRPITDATVPAFAAQKFTGQITAALADMEKPQKAA